MERFSAMIALFPSLLAVALGLFGIVVGIGIYGKYQADAIELIVICLVLALGGLILAIKSIQTLRSTAKQINGKKSQPESPL